MTVEQLHDALNQLPDDLIAGTDTLRQKEKRKPVLWKRLVPMAACFVLVLGVLFIAPFFQSGKSAAQESLVEKQDEAMQQVAGAPETAPAARSEEPEAPMEQMPVLDENRQESENTGAPLAPEAEEEAGSTEAPTPVTAYGYRIGAEEPDEIQITVISTAGEWERYLADNPRLRSEGGFENRYEEAYFEDNQLIAVVTEAGNSSIRYEIDSIQRTGPGTWSLGGIRYEPEWQTEDMEQQLLLIELPRMVEPEDTVVLNLEIVEDTQLDILLTEPPAMTVRCGEGEATVGYSGASWSSDSQTFIACGVSPGSLWDGEPTLITSAEEVELIWSVMPDSIAARCWSNARSTETWDVEFPVEVTGNVLALDPDCQIYEITAVWDSAEGYGGNASYAVFILPQE